uniref:TSC22 domain family protein 1-like n=1 Tax=Syphacia muris TaxID=451379 RepID=A0A0N5AN63_9BILA
MVTEVLKDDISASMKNGNGIATSDVLNYGLERSLNTTTSHSDKSILNLLPGNAGVQDNHRNANRARFEKSASAVAAPGGPLFVAIDSKIEQAMDLVKTHLMFAVREEVEMLRAKISELEGMIIQLDAENAVLREHIPTEMLNKISIQMSQPKAAATAAVQ